MYLALVSIIVSCKKEVKDALVKVDSTAESISILRPVIEECYGSIVKNDTVVMSLTFNQDKTFVGKLNYKLFQKDRNTGTLTGIQKGDTLIADYTFMSEGTTSVRQVAFLKNGETYIEGFGYMIDDSSGRIVFRHLNQLKFDRTIVLTKEDCKN